MAMEQNIAAQKIEALKQYFQDRQEVMLAFLFGSQAKGSSIARSDWDVAVYFDPQAKDLEWEENKFYPSENQIWQDLERMLEKEVDLVVLNRAPSTIVFAVLSSGLSLIIRDRIIFLDLLSKTSYEAIDFRDFCYDFRQIKQRSQSLSLEDRSRLLEIEDFLSSEAEDFARFKGLSWQEYQSERSKRHDVERWIENIVNASLDIAKIILASEKKNIPPTYQETLRLLGTTKFFDLSFSERFAGWAKLRNILAHHYLDIKWEQIKRFIQEAESDVSFFIQKVSQIIEERAV